jgi:hypothetical protein
LISQSRGLGDVYKRQVRKNFKRNPEGLNLQERKTRPYFGWIFFILKTANDNLSDTIYIN